MSRRRYATRIQLRQCLEAARAEGIEVAAVEFKPNGALVVIDRASLDAAPAPAHDPARERVAEAALDDWLARHGPDHA